MLSFGLKMTWFSLSLSGLVGSWAVVHAFATATQEFWLALSYCIASTALQGIFCLGLIWRLDPFRMPRSFCVAQAILIHASWVFIAGICAAITTSTAGRTLRRSKVLGCLAFSPLCRLILVAGIPCILLVAQAVVMPVRNVVRASDGMYCDAYFPLAFRTLGYAGATLLLAVPSFTLSFTTAIQLLHSRPINHSSEVQPTSTQDNTLTHLPVRRSRRRSYRTSPSLPRTQEPAVFPPSSMEPLFPSTRTVYAIPSVPDSASTIGVPGRARVVAGRTRYHLPNDWIETRYSPDFSLDNYDREHHTGPEDQSRLMDPSPIIFANSRVECTRDPNRGDSPALSGETEKDSIHLRIYAGFSPDGRLATDKDDSTSTSLWWTRRSESSTGVKSELVFASLDEESEYDAATIRYEESLRMASFKPSRQPSPPSADVDAAPWPILAFQLLSSSTQILAAISSLIDIASGTASPTPFGTQHIALLLAAWAPCMIFGGSFLVKRLIR